jgi:hypothetical protein
MSFSSEVEHRSSSLIAYVLSLSYWAMCRLFYIRIPIVSADDIGRLYEGRWLTVRTSGDGPLPLMWKWETKSGETVRKPEPMREPVFR